MKIFIIIERDELNGNHIRFRTSETPGLHIVELFHVETLEDCYDYALAFERGAKVAGADTLIVIDEKIADEMTDNELPKYTREMRRDSFGTVWTVLE